MPSARKKSPVLRVALLLAPLSLGLAACETLESLNFLDEKKTPLTGDRRVLFPNGVPGVQHNAPPTQPTNSNIQITPGPQSAPDGNPEAQQNQQQAPVANTNEDPWAGQRRR